MNNLLFIHALSPLHAGTGQGIGVIDLPIAREKATNLPYLAGSSIKGVLRDQWNAFDVAEGERQKLEAEQKALFGAGGNNLDQAGAINFGDARLLLLPVRSLKGTFAWVTSPYLLQRFARDVEYTQHEVSAPDLKIAENGCWVNSASGLLHKHNNYVYLEDLDLKAQINQPGCQQWSDQLAAWLFASDPYWQDCLGERFCIVPDDILDFLLETATEIVARIRLEDESKTVTKGGLWYEESLPTESVLYSLTVSSRPFKQKGTDTGSTLQSASDVSNTLRERLANTYLQFGGKATVGRGMCRVVMA